MEHISIIIPVYNRAKAFWKALDSIVAQTYKDIEVTVVDDGSRDTYQIPDTIYKKIPIKYIKQNHAGASAARNRGFRESKGEYVIFWDADVVGEREMIEKMYCALQKHTEVSYAYCNFYLENGIHMKAIEFDGEHLKKKNYINTASLIRRADFVGFDESLTRFQDWDLWLTMLKNKKNGMWINETLFRVIAKGKISAWLPQRAYHAPWKYLPIISKRVREYEHAREIVYSKHCIDE